MKWIVLVVVLLVAGKCTLDAREAVSTSDMLEMIEQEKLLMKGRCNNEEKIDRWLLQQSWFYDPDYRQLAGAFGQTSFTLYPRSGDYKLKKDGLFCISGNSLEIQYVEEDFVPKSVDFSSFPKISIKFGRKLALTTIDSFQVKQIDRETMKLIEDSTETQLTLYRK